MMTESHPTIACEFCGRPLRVTSPHATRLRYHATCKREVDRLRHQRLRDVVGAGTEHTHVCDQCGVEFEAKRADARYCSPKCRVAAHRERALVR